MTFRQHMIENYSLSTVKTTLSPIVSIYKYYEIEIVELPRMNIKGIKTPEAVTAINSYLLSRADPLTNNSPLFKINEDYFSEAFIRINNKLGLGKVGTYNRFRSHMLRKFHASALYNDGMSLDNVNDLQGKAGTV